MKNCVIIVTVALALISCIGGGGGNSEAAGEKEVQSTSSITSDTKSGDLVEVLYFHGKQRCVTCVAIGTEAKVVVDELANDRVVLRDVDFSTSEGEKIADKYEIASSSIIVVRGGKVENLTAVGFQYAKNNPERFRENLKGSIQKMLN